MLTVSLRDSLSDRLSSFLRVFRKQNAFIIIRIGLTFYGISLSREILYAMLNAIKMSLAEFEHSMEGMSSKRVSASPK